MSKWHGGKGDGQRLTNRKRFAENYETIFNKKDNAGIQGQADKKQAVKFNFCPRCGKRLSGNPDWVHTCTPPEGHEREDKAGLTRTAQEQAVAIVKSSGKSLDGYLVILDTGNVSIPKGAKIYATPPKRQPLSKDEIAKLWGDDELRNPLMVRNFVRAIEKAHGIGE